jgi:hypothetical protein
MKKKIYSIIDNAKKYVPIIAKEIVETFESEANGENVEYSYTIDGATKGIKGKDANTYFVFDTAGETCIDDFKKLLFHEDLADIEDGSKEEEKLMEDVREFLFKVCKRITSDYKSDIQKTIRRVVLGGRYKEEKVPLKDIDMISIDVADYSSVPESFKYILRIGKAPGTEIDTDEIIQFVQNRQELTGMDIDSVFSIEKQAGNPLFKNVIVIEPTRKFLNEISIYFFVDYTIEMTEEEKEIVKKQLESENEETKMMETES